MSAEQVLVTEPSRAEAYAVYPYYQIGIGGLCNGLFEPNVSVWCNPRNQRDGLLRRGPSVILPSPFSFIWRIRIYANIQ